MDRRNFLTRAGAAGIILVVSPHLILAQPKLQSTPYENNNASVDPKELAIDRIADSTYIFSSELELLLSNGEVTKLTSNPVGLVIKGKDDVGKEALLLLTADHNVSDYRRISDTPDGQRQLEVRDRQGNYTLETEDKKTVKLRRLASDFEYDIALLRLPDGAKVKVFPYKLGDSNNLVTGSFLYIIGNPGGIGKSGLEGKVSSKIEPNDVKFRFNTTTPPGTSGGPILAVRKDPDRKGQYELVGVTVRGYTDLPFGYGVLINRIIEKFGKYLAR